MRLDQRSVEDTERGETGKEIGAQSTEDLEEQIEGFGCDPVKEEGPALPMPCSYTETPARPEAPLTTVVAMCQPLAN